MNARNKIISDYSNLADGISLAGQMCPECNGGSTKEYSLSVSREGDNLKWMCHRNSCKFKGGTSLLLVNVERKVLPSAKRKLKFTASPLIPEASKFLESRYNITPELTTRFGLEFTNDLSSYPSDGRISIPIRSRDLSLRGHVLRAVHPDEQRKAINVIDGSDGGLAWFNAPGSGVVLLVEDCYSAIRAAKYINTCALLGTNLSSDGIEELLSSGLNNFYIALDKDAFNKTIDTVYKYKSRINLKGVPLSKDIKDMTEDELVTFLTSLT